MDKSRGSGAGKAGGLTAKMTVSTRGAKERGNDADATLVEDEGDGKQGEMVDGGDDDDDYMDVEDDDDADHRWRSNQEKQQVIISDLLDTARKNTKKMQHNLSSRVSIIFGSAEEEVDALQKSSEELIADCLKTLDAYTSRIPASPPLECDAVQAQIATFQSLTETAAQAMIRGPAGCYDFDRHMALRKKHCDKISKKGASLAQKVLYEHSRHQKVMDEARAFTKAHRELFRTLEAVHSGSSAGGV